MRAIPFLAGLFAAGLVAGCTPSVKHVTGEAGPVTAAPTRSSGSPSPSSSPSPRRTSASPTSSPPATTGSTGTASLVLGPKGLGDLKLRMSVKQASATGLIDPWRGDGAKDCAYTELKATDAEVTAGRGGLGVVAIDAYGKVRTPEGIRLGSSLAAVLDAYPDLRGAPGGTVHDTNGIGFADVPGNSNAVYRITWRDRKVSYLTLQDDKENCYE